ncbi:hypothetical protein NX059_012448 [Plenodomus lindquistii]|nr:hypothetical protein NX059_012448 [Plenodomus lindquistii]
MAVKKTMVAITSSLLRRVSSTTRCRTLQGVKMSPQRFAHSSDAGSEMLHAKCHGQRAGRQGHVVCDIELPAYKPCLKRSQGYPCVYSPPQIIIKSLFTRHFGADSRASLVKHIDFCPGNHQLRYFVIAHLD